VEGRRLRRLHDAVGVKRLDLSVEAYVPRPEYAPLFTEEDSSIARARLGEYGYAV
jgi:hypothetical protein